MIGLKTGIATTSLNRPTPKASAAACGASDSGIFTVSERLVQLSSQFDRSPMYD